ncbi:MAG: CobW family GTP-binding protein [Acetobacteraceae bacterium]
MTPTPLTVIGGFLGAGKTTLLNHLLRDPAGRRMTVLVNDFGAINVDADLIAKHDGETIALSNGCICCSIGNSLVAALIGLTRQAHRPDQIVVEASGIADPGRIAEIAFLEPSVRLSGIIVVADAEQLRRQADDRYVGDALRSQIAAAEILILNKVDLISEAAREETASWVRQHAPGAKVVQAVRSAVPAGIVLGFDREAGRTWPGWTGKYPHDVGDYTAILFKAGRPFRMQALRRVLDALPSGVLRAKGQVITDENPDTPAVLQLVGKRWSLEPSPSPSSRPGNRLVIIGLKGAVEAEEIEARFASALCE